MKSKHVTQDVLLRALSLIPEKETKLSIISSKLQRNLGITKDQVALILLKNTDSITKTRRGYYKRSKPITNDPLIEPNPKYYGEGVPDSINKEIGILMEHGYNQQMLFDLAVKIVKSENYRIFKPVTTYEELV